MGVSPLSGWMAVSSHGPSPDAAIRGTRLDKTNLRAHIHDAYQHHHSPREPCLRLRGFCCWSWLEALFVGVEHVCRSTLVLASYDTPRSFLLAG